MRNDPATNYAGQKMRLEGGDQREITAGEPTIQFAGQLDHFSKAIREGTPIRTPGEMRLRDLRLIEAIHASAASGRTISLSPDARMRS